MVQLSLAHARKYYANRTAYDAAWAEEMGEVETVTIGE